MNILAFGAHPDDIEYGCGGTLLQFAQNGHDIYLMIFTQGESGGNADIRFEEQKASAQLLQARDLFWGGFTDTKIPGGKELIDRMESVIKSVRPDLLFVNFWDDTHQDHRTLSKAAISATRYVRNVLFYETPTTENFNPQVYVNIADVLDKKLSLLKTHASQMLKTNIEGLSILEFANANATFRGIQGRVKFAEGFAPVRYFINVYPNGSRTD